ncbi:group III truncated hemoglobin [Flavobacterium sp.]|uniref:group III truncated hemoglobin n=1 Tax=Flavobacterium sp. TaxID=239 RepID=UPI0022C83E22|nr:group III truncated hemoglobin [Flavobacterium sp.]MCZ8089160.1 group III truncated hemoglobin [Flavobacterium sp.]
MFYLVAMNDIQTQDDLYKLVDEFYKKLFVDERISYIFTEVIPIHLHLEEHLQVLVKFWSQAILGTGGYTNNLTQLHLDVDLKSRLTPELFTIWLHHFYNTVDENFEGNKAEQIKTQALSIATIMQIKIAQQNPK